MIVLENECVDCGLPCIYSGCMHYKVKHYFCDECKEEKEQLYDYDDRQLCIDCIEKQLDKVE